MSRNTSATEQARAIGDLMTRSIHDPTAALDLVDALDAGGFVAEQAALTLYRRTGQPLPPDRANIELSTEYWRPRVESWLRKISAEINNRLQVVERP